MKYTLVGEIKPRDIETTEQQFWEVMIFEDHWIIWTHGLFRYGRGSDLIYSVELNPDSEESGYSITNGYHTIYHNMQDFIENQKVPDEDMLVTPEGSIPCPSWAVACLLD